MTLPAAAAAGWIAGEAATERLIHGIAAAGYARFIGAFSFERRSRQDPPVAAARVAGFKATVRARGMLCLAPTPVNRTKGRRRPIAPRAPSIGGDGPARPIAAPRDLGW